MLYQYWEGFGFGWGTKNIATFFSSQLYMDEWWKTAESRTWGVSLWLPSSLRRYSSFAIAFWMHDKDAVTDKLAAYYEYVVK